MMFYIGIDGGGTKTKFTIINEKEELINSVEKGTCHYNQIGFDGLERVLTEGLNELIKDKVNKCDISGVCLGLAGYGKVKSDALKVEEIVSKVFEGVPYKLLNDVQIAHAGALAGQDGVVIIAGTGSIGYSLNKGENRRVGGWGYTIGDEGSAYWIGRKSIEAFSKQADGRLEKGKLYENFKEELNLEDDYKMISYINSDIKADRGEVAKFARICSKSAVEGDSTARDIFNNAGEELAGLINVLAKDFDGKVMASYIGGVFKSEKFIIEPIKNKLNKDIELKDPKYSPDMGACLIAKSL
ncbi:MAG: BadF/BadG/BcrA/BcrD ATPase family protein [Clostridium sp.]